MFEYLKADLSRAMRETRDDPNWQPSLGKRLEVMVRHSTWPVVAYRYSSWARGVKIPVIGQLLRILGLFLRKFSELLTSVHIDVRAKIGPGFVIHSVYAINIGAVKTGENFTVASGVMIGHACRGIGDNVYFGPGAKLVGDAKVGNNVVIAANSLVLTDVKDNLMVMGVPARIKLRGGRPARFIKKPDAEKEKAAALVSQPVPPQAAASAAKQPEAISASL
jgi:serine O-acetyltransferase